MIKRNTEIEINGVKIPVLVTIEVRDSDIMPEDTYDFPEDIQRIKSGELFLADIAVTAHAYGCEGYDNLGAVELHPNNLFDHKPFETDLEQALAYNQMIETALDDLRAAITVQANTLKPFASK